MLESELERPDSMETGGISLDIGEILDSINDASGPAIFDNVDKQAALYAKSHFSRRGRA